MSAILINFGVFAATWLSSLFFASSLKFVSHGLKVIRWSVQSQAFFASLRWLAEKILIIAKTIKAAMQNI